MQPSDCCCRCSRPARSRRWAATSPPDRRSTSTSEITTGSDGPELSSEAFELTTGEYYRLNITSDGVETWRLEVDDLLSNSHLRLVTINGIEVHLQALAFRGIEFDVAGAAQFSFTPIRTGTFEFTVGDTPSARRARADGGRTAVGIFTVE